MGYLVGNLIESVSGLMTGTSLDNVTNLYGAIERAVRTVTQKTGSQDATGKETLTIYNNVPYYNAPSTIFGTSITQIRSQGDTQSPLDYDYKVTADIFSRRKNFLPNGYMFDFEFQNGDTVMGLVSPRAKPSISLDPMNSTTGWVASGNASNLTTDSAVFYQNQFSLRFNLAAAGSQGILTKTISKTDLSAYQALGVIFVAINTPNAAATTSIAVRLGSSSTAYDEVTSTTGFLGSWSTGEWTLVALDLATATTTGSPNRSAITYSRIAVNYNGTAMINFRIGSFFIALPCPTDVFFQSSAAFVPIGGNPTMTITAESDTILVNPAAYTILEYETARQVGLQMSGGVYTDQIKGFDVELYGTPQNGSDGLYQRYRADNPSGEIRMIGSYY